MLIVIISPCLLYICFVRSLLFPFQIIWIDWIFWFENHLHWGERLLLIENWFQLFYNYLFWIMFYLSIFSKIWLIRDCWSLVNDTLGEVSHSKPTYFEVFYVKEYFQGDFKERLSLFPWWNTFQVLPLYTNLAALIIFLIITNQYVKILLLIRLCNYVLLGSFFTSKWVGLALLSSQTS